MCGLRNCNCILSWMTAPKCSGLVTGFLRWLVCSDLYFYNETRCPLFLKGLQEDSHKCRKVTISGKEKMCQQHKTSATEMKIIHFSLRPTKIIKSLMPLYRSFLYELKNTSCGDHICPSVCDLVSVTKPFVKFSWNLVQDFFTKSCRISRSFMKVCTLNCILKGIN